jgi:hypothetical protein
MSAHRHCKNHRTVRGGPPSTARETETGLGPLQNQRTGGLRTRVEAEGGDWWKWQTGKFDRSRKDMEKLMRLASSEDPEAAVEDERTKQKARDDRRPRARSGACPAPTNGADVGSEQLHRPVACVAPPSDVDHILYAVRALTMERTSAPNNCCDTARRLG